MAREKTKKVEHKEEKPAETKAAEENKQTEMPEHNENKTQNKILATVALIAIIIVIAVIIYGNYGIKKFEPESPASGNVIAVVNGEEITESELDKEYRFFFFVTGYPPQYQSMIPKKEFLNQTIAQMLLLQQAKELGYKVEKEEAKQQLELSIQENMLSTEEFELKVKEANFTMDDVIDYSAKQITLSKFIEETIFSSITVSDKEIGEFYEKNKNLMQGAALKNVSSLIKQELTLEKQREMLQTTISMLMESADIQIMELPETKAAGAAVSTVNFAECASKYNVSSSTVIFYHANWCPHCQNMVPIVEELQNAGYTFHYAETSENTGTEVIECFQEFMEGGVPQFICAGTGEIAVGEMPSAELKEFADNCNKN